MVPFLASLPSPPSPTVFEVGPLALHYYGLCMALGVFVGTWLTSRELARRGYPRSLAFDSLVLVVPLGLVGARLYHLATDWHLYADDPIPGVIAVWNGGLGIYGAVAGGLLGAYVFCRWRGMRLLELADSAAPGVVLGQAIARWGNYFNQELFGHPSDLPWAVEISRAHRPAGFADAQTFHPTFLYESVWDALVCVALLWVARRFARSLKAGDVFLLYVSLYSVGRFFVETLRIDPAFLIGGTVRGNLFVSSLLALGFAMALLLRHSRGAGKRPGRGRDPTRSGS